MVNNVLSWYALSLHTQTLKKVRNLVYTCFASEVGIVLVALARIVTCGCKAAVTEVVRIIAALKINDAGIVSSVIVVCPCSDVGNIACM